jgi:hypothetical protein
MPHRNNIGLHSGYGSDLRERLNLSRRFYKLLLVFIVLQTHVGLLSTATLPSSKPKDDPKLLSNEELRREFTRHLGYLCNYDKGGDRATAVALEGNSPGLLTYWFASNKSPQLVETVGWLKTIV